MIVLPGLAGTSWLLEGQTDCKKKLDWSMQIGFEHVSDVNSAELEGRLTGSACLAREKETICVEQA